MVLVVPPSVSYRGRGLNTARVLGGGKADQAVTSETSSCDTGPALLTATTIHDRSMQSAEFFNRPQTTRY